VQKINKGLPRKDFRSQEK